MAIQIERAYTSKEIKNPVPPFTLFWSKGKHNSTEILMILTPPLDIPHFQDNVASRAAWSPLDIQDPKEWGATFPAYICWDLIAQEYSVVSHNGLNPEEVIDFERKNDLWDSMSSYIPFDIATGKLRGLSALLVLANKMGRKPAAEVFWPKTPPE